MKTVIRLAMVLLLAAVSLQAQVINNTSMSAEWSRTANRNAATDAADILVYNPGGLTKLPAGLHIDFGNQALLRQPEHTFDLGGVQNFQQGDPDWLLPSLFAAYRFKDFAVYAGLYIVGGGASADYDTGSITTSLYGAAYPSFPLIPPSTTFENPKLKATSFLLATQAGGTWALNKAVAVSAGVRYVYGFTSVTMSGDSVTLGTPTPLKGEAELSASGFGGVFGVCVTPTDKLVLALRFDTSVRLEYETSLKASSLAGFTSIFTNGDKSRTDLPAVFAAGAAWDFGTVRAELNFTWFFQSAADWGGSNADWAGDCFNIGAAVRMQLTERLDASLGYVYTRYLWEDMGAYYSSVVGSVEAPSMDNHYVAFGIGWKLRNNLKLNLGIGMTFYPDKTITLDADTLLGLPASTLGTYSVKLENMAFTVALGVDWRINL